MQRFTKWLLCVFVAGGLQACSKGDDGPSSPTPTPPPPPPNIQIFPPADFGFKYVGYFPSYRDPAVIPDQKFRMTNVVNYAFASVGANGLPTIGNPDRLITILTRAKAQQSKVMLSVNGSTTDWKNMANTTTGRNNFIKALMQQVRAYQLDGLDIDWEFPRTDDGTDILFSALMKELSDSCHRDGKYYLSAAITAGKYPGAVRDAIKSEVFGYVDWMNIMSYDDFSTSVPYVQHAPMSLAQTSLNYWITTRGLPKSKAVLGYPAYGRPSGISQSGNILTYAEILAKGGTALSDSALVNHNAQTYTIYYNGTRTVKLKAKMAQAQANGIMTWELWQDTHDANSLLKAACDTLGRSY